MIVGASTSCFYPLETEKALRQVIRLGYKQAEIFFNADSELEPSFVGSMKKQADDAGLQVLSVHPFSSFLESNCIFCDYERRYNDFIDIYRRTCHAAAVLGAKYVVIHGALEKPKRPLPEEHYFERFKGLIDIGKSEGVMICQENVNRFRSQSIDFCKKMRQQFGSDFNMVFDVKQAIRAGYDPFDFVDELKDNIVHIHISDNCAQADCMPPGRGNFDFARLFSKMKAAGYKGSYVIEIYSMGYDVYEELKFSKAYLNRIEV